jgi:hypothetical protein
MTATIYACQIPRTRHKIRREPGCGQGAETNQRKKALLSEEKKQKTFMSE